jgi:TrmH family RNA methyltransferase
MVISSRENERWKAMRRLSGSKGKRRPGEEDRLLVEGLHLLEAAIDAGLDPDPVLATPDLLAAAPPLLERLRRPPLAVAPALLDELADADSPRGVVATVSLPDKSLDDLSRIVSRAAEPVVLVLADGLQDPANLGALARTAEAAGAAALLATRGTAGWRHPRALRASTGSLLRLPVLADTTPAHMREVLAPFGFTWVALETRGGEDVYHAELGARVVVMVGAEAAGLSPTSQTLADRRITIPLAPGVESLNAHVAAAVVLFELRRRSLRTEGRRSP